MSTFPTGVQTFPVSSGSEVLNVLGSGTGLAGMLNLLAVDLTAVETKLGTGSSTAAANQILFGTGAGTSAWQGLTSAQLASVLSDETGSGAAVFANSPTIVTPTVASFVNANHDHSNSAGGGLLTHTALPVGAVVQVVDALFTAVATGTTVLPYDDTIPQITEGDQYMTLAITPKSTTNKLIIEATAHLANSATAQRLTAALFQDSTANALGVGNNVPDVATSGITVPVVVYHSMTAGTTSATTFRIRAGANGVGTTTFNGDGSARKFGGITYSYLKITEVKA